jgi:predicted nuclease of restriction endonuclease-like RecB superfamily
MTDLGIYFILGGIVFIIVFVLCYIAGQKFRNFFKKGVKSTQVTSFKCIDGHVVRSKGELIIDNHLHRLGIKHEYERTIRVRGNPIKYDWYIPKEDVYIEYWGFYGKEYEKRKAEKLNLYRKGKLKLISIENEMFDNIYHNLEKELKKYINLKEVINHNKFCPGCGFELDKRF